MSLQPLATFPSPLRYPGGKRKVRNFMKLLLLGNDLVGCDYIEPYAGGASVALSLLYEEYAARIHINDIDLSVIAFWRAVLDHTDELCARIADTPVTIEEWHRQRAVQLATDADELDLAFSTFFLNRTNRSGIISGGIIGGKAQAGTWKVDARYSKANLIQRVQKAARFRNRITVTDYDAAELLPDWERPPDHPAFMYLDPPYYVKGDGLYENFYTDGDHRRIRDLVHKLAIPWVVSYDPAPAILTLYDGHPDVRYSLSYSAADRQGGDEVMYFSNGLIVPAVESPSCVPVSVVDAARQLTTSRS